jgi:hypothetical protein
VSLSLSTPLHGMFSAVSLSVSLYPSARHVLCCVSLSISLYPTARRVLCCVCVCLCLSLPLCTACSLLCVTVSLCLYEASKGYTQTVSCARSRAVGDFLQPTCFPHLSAPSWRFVGASCHPFFLSALMTQAPALVSRH